MPRLIFSHDVIKQLRHILGFHLVLYHLCPLVIDLFPFEHLRDPLFSKIEELALTEVDSCISVIFAHVCVVELLSLIENSIAFSFVVGVSHLGNLIVVSYGTTKCEP